MTPNTDRPTPRDLIEAPATEAVVIRVASSPELLGIVRAREIQKDIQRLIDRNWGSGVTVSIEAPIALAAARDEGRQEAVREIRAVMATTPCYRPGCICEDGPIARHNLNRILNEVARHGRSSDPTTAVTCEECGGTGAVFVESGGESGHDVCEGCGGSGRVERADPALQAVGEPPHKDCNCVNCESGPFFTAPWRAGATGEGESPA